MKDFRNEFFLELQGKLEKISIKGRKTIKHRICDPQNGKCSRIPESSDIVLQKRGLKVGRCYFKSSRTDISFPWNTFIEPS